MRKKDIRKIILGVIVIILFSLVLITIFSFNRNTENINNVYDDNKEIKEENKKEEITFNNNSDMSEKDIRELVEEKRTSLKEYLSHITYYKLSEISLNYDGNSDDTYIGIPYSFFTGLNDLITEELYDSYFSKCSLVQLRDDVSINGSVYMAPINLFDETFTSSAVAVNDVNTETLLLKTATNDNIEAVEEIKICSSEDDNSCTRNSKYDLVLTKENEVWKIAKIN